MTHDTAHRVYQFLIAPRAPNALPEAILVTEDSQRTAMARAVDPNNPPPVFIDRYSCNLHSDMGAMRGQPGYAALKARVVDELTRHPDLTVLVGQPPGAGGGQGCRWPVFSSPGLGQ